VRTVYQLEISDDACLFRVLWATGQTDWAPWYAFEQLTPRMLLNPHALAEVHFGKRRSPTYQLTRYPLTRPLTVSTNQTHLKFHPDDGYGLMKRCGQWPPSSGANPIRMTLTFTWETL
jgi:hypothetical protein